MKNKTYSFTFSLTFVFASLLITSFVSIILYNYFKTSSDLYAISKNVNKEIRNTVIEKTIAQLEKVATHLKVLCKADNSSDILKNKENTLKIMWEQLNSDETIASIFVADEDSNFIQARRKPAFATRVIETYENTRMELFEFKNSDYTTRAMETYISTYNPLTRDWYENANQKDTFYWSGPYIFASTGQTGITIAYPNIDEYGKKTKVAAADITVDSISDFLRTQTKVVGGDLILLGVNNEVIAASFLDKIDKQVNGKIITLKELPLEYYGGFAPLLASSPLSGDYVDTKGDEYIYDVSTFPTTFSKRWSLVTFVKKDTLLASVRNTVNKMLLISFVITVFFLSIIFYVATKISSPIIKLATAMQHLQKMNLDINIEDNSVIKEIKVAQNSLMSLQSGLESFKKYMPSELVKILIQTNQEAKIGGSEKNLAVMFTDIESFTTISETMSPEDLMIHLSNYFEELVPIIMSHKGTVDKYIGDAILAFWGAPLEIEDPCLVAVEAAIAMQKRLEIMNDQWEREGKPRFKTRIGIHFGPTLVGNVGSHERLNYTIIGDSVNIAARLEGINKNFGTKIMISEVVNTHIQQRIATRYVDSILLKGKTEETKMYTIEGV